MKYYLICSHDMYWDDMELIVRDTEEQALDYASKHAKQFYLIKGTLVMHGEVEPVIRGNIRIISRGIEDTPEA